MKKSMKKSMAGANMMDMSSPMPSLKTPKKAGKAMSKPAKGVKSMGMKSKGAKTKGMK